MNRFAHARLQEWVREGRVRVNDSVVRDPESPVIQGWDRIAVDGQEANADMRPSSPC